MDRRIDKEQFEAGGKRHRHPFWLDEAPAEPSLSAVSAGAPDLEGQTDRRPPDHIPSLRREDPGQPRSERILPSRPRPDPRVDKRAEDVIIPVGARATRPPDAISGG